MDLQKDALLENNDINSRYPLCASELAANFAAARLASRPSQLRAGTMMLPPPTPSRPPTKPAVLPTLEPTNRS